MSIGLNPSAWTEFFFVVTTVAGVLLGLVLVAISLHMPAIDLHPTLKHRARATLEAMAALLLTSLVVLIPGQGDFWLGAEIVAITVAYWALLIAGTALAYRSTVPFPRHIWMRMTLNVVTLFTVVAGVSLMLGRGPGLYLQLPAVLIGIPGLMFNVWSLLFAPELRERRSVSESPVLRGPDVSRIGPTPAARSRRR